MAEETAEGSCSFCGEVVEGPVVLYYSSGQGVDAFVVDGHGEEVEFGHGVNLSNSLFNDFYDGMTLRRRDVYILKKKNDAKLLRIIP